MPFSFNLENREIIDNDHANDVYQFNLAQNHALLSGSSAVVRRFYQLDARRLSNTDIFKHIEISRSFFANAKSKNAFVYSGFLPWAVESIVRLVASNGFQVNSVLGEDEFNKALQKDLDDYIKKVIEEIDLQDLFEKGVYLESGLGDFAYRISYDKSLSEKPIIDVIEPQYLEIHRKRGKVQKIVIKESTDKISVDNGYYDKKFEIKEIYTKKQGKIFVNYEFYTGDRKLTKNSKFFGPCKNYWGIDKMEIVLPFKDFPIVYKKNNKKSELYLGERGVPDINGLDTIEDALSETLSHLVDTIRKASPKLFVDEELLPVGIKGDTYEFNEFDHEFLLLKESGADPSKLLSIVQAKIDYQSHVETIKTLISYGINKLGLSPTTLGITGLESINSSQESQDSREKPSLRTREEKLKGWSKTLKELLDKYFQYLAYVNGEEIGSYKDMFNITFNEYISPATENVLSVIAAAVSGRVYSIEMGVEKVFLHEKKNYTLEDIIIEAARIRGISLDEEIKLLGLEIDVENEAQQTPTLENTEGNTPSVFHNQNQPTEALNEEEDNGGSNPTNRE